MQPAPEPDPKYLTLDEIATELRVNIATVRGWIAKGKLEYIDLGQTYRVSREAYDRFLQARTRQAKDREDTP